MTSEEISKAREEWETKCTGTSPLQSNLVARIQNLAKQEFIVREVIGTFKNGISHVGYKDKQNRFICTTYEV